MSLPATLPPEIRGWIAQLPLRRASTGAVLFREGEPCRGFVVVLDGVIRVTRRDPEGREITLYRVRSGQTCMLTTLCLLTGRPHTAEGVVERDARFALASPSTFEAWLAEQAFRRFVFDAFAERLDELVALVEALAFRAIARRLAERLLALADADGEVAATHQQLAAELGAARESVSRALKTLERRGWLRLSRGRVAIEDPDALRRFADEAADEARR